MPLQFIMVFNIYYMMLIQRSFLLHVKNQIIVYNVKKKSALCVFINWFNNLFVVIVIFILISQQHDIISV